MKVRQLKEAYKREHGTDIKGHLIGGLKMSKEQLQEKMAKGDEELKRLAEEEKKLPPYIETRLKQEE